MNDNDDNYERIIARLTNAPTIHIPARAHIDPRMTSALMRVFMSMCWHLNEDWVCWPGQDLLASELHITQQAVSKSIRQLIALGYVEIVRHGFRGVGQTNVYRVIFQPNAENLAEKYSGNPHKSENAEKSSDAPSRINPHIQPQVVSIHNPTLSHTQPEVVQKYNHEEYQGRSSSEDSLLPTSLAQRADSAPPTVTAPPERRTRERLNVSALKRDPLIVTLIACFGVEPATTHEWDSWRIAVNDLHAAGATSSDIPRAIKGYQALHPTGRITPMALARNWSQIREGKSHDLAQLEIAQRARSAAVSERRQRDAADAERKAQERAEVERLLSEYGYADGGGHPPRR